MHCETDTQKKLRTSGIGGCWSIDDKSWNKNRTVASEDICKEQEKLFNKSNKLLIKILLYLILYI